MPARRSFDYDYLKRLVIEHPDWTHREYADALTDYMREVTGDPKYPRIRPNTISAAFNRYRDTWLEEGIRMPAKKPNRVLPWVGIPEGYRMDTRLRRLRTLGQMASGERVGPRDEELALKFQRSLREGRQVVDLTPSGRPVVRGARPDEIDGTGELLSLYARHPGLTYEQWESMTPEQRERASACWLEEDALSRRVAG